LLHVASGFACVLSLIMVLSRPATLLAAASLLQFAVASPPADITVVATVTNTHTVCPWSTEIPTTCPPAPTRAPHVPSEGDNDKLPDEVEMSEIYESWLSEHNTVSLIDEVTKTWGDWYGAGSTSKSTATVSSTSRDYTGSSLYYPSSSYTGSSSLHTGYPATSGIYNGTSTTTSSTRTSTSSGSPTPTCPLKTAKQPEGKANTDCNSPGNRSKWCGGKSIDTDYYTDYFSGKTCTYDLTITNTSLTFDKGSVQAFAINGQSPGPVIECNWVCQSCRSVFTSNTGRAIWSKSLSTISFKTMPPQSTGMVSDK
jgi:hypothetical protein